MITERRQGERNRLIRPVNLLLCFAGLLAIAFSITLRNIQTAMLPEHLTSLYLTPRIFNKLNGSFENTLIVTLIFSGLIVDLIGPRIVLMLAVGCSIVADYLFCSTTTVSTLMACRLLTEYSHIFILMSVLTLGCHWLPRRHFSTFAGLAFGVLLLVPVALSTPLAALFSDHGVEFTTGPMMLLGSLIIVMIAATQFTPDMTRRRSDIYSHFNPLRYYKIWLIGLIAMVGWMTNTFLLGVGVYYLTQEFNFAVNQAMETINLSFIYFAAGIVITGLIADFFEKKRYVIVVCYCLAAFLFSAVIFLPGLSPSAIAWLIYVTAFLAGGSIVCYTTANDYCAIENCGIALGLVLSISTIGSSYYSRSIHHFIRSTFNPALITDHHICRMIVLSVPISLLIGALVSYFLLLRPQHILQKTAGHAPTKRGR